MAPHIKQKFGFEVALVLERALLWYMYSSEAPDVPKAIFNRVNNKIDLPKGMDNSVKKIPFTVSGADAEVYFNDVEDFEMKPSPAAQEAGQQDQNQGQQPAAAAPPPPPRPQAFGNIASLGVRDQIVQLHNQQRMLYNQNIQITKMLKEQDRQRAAEYRRLNQNIQRIAIQPARRVGRSNN